MTRYCSNSPFIKGIKKSIKKWGTIEVYNNDLKGNIQITNIRLYEKFRPSWEVDVVFKGQVFLRVNGDRKFYGPSLQKKPRISKVKLNRIIRKLCEKHVNMRLKYFGGEITYYNQISKIKWT